MTTEINISNKLDLEPLDEEANHSQGSTASFYEQPHSKSDEDYKGPERRTINRRTLHDRREDFRFDEKKDRRSGKERRKGNWNYTYNI